MARIENALITYLLAQTDITDLVSTRIVASDIDANTNLPCLVYQKISDVLDHELTGQQSLERPVFQFSAYATTKDGALDISEALETALADYQGALSGVTVQYIKLLNRYSTKSKDMVGGFYYVEDLEFEVNYVKE